MKLVSKDPVMKLRTGPSTKLGARLATAHLAIAVGLVATGASGAERGEPLGSVLVTATRYPVPRDQVLPATLVIERDALQLNIASDVADVLRFQSGLEFGRYGGPGQTSSMFMRGTDSNHTLVLVDGVRINPGTVGGAALQNIAPALVERIEVVKGPRSTLYGTDAIGGVVHIFTRARGMQGFSSEVGYGADNTRFGAATAGFGGETAHVGVGVSYFETDGFAPRTVDSRGGAHDNLGVNLAGSIDVGSGDLQASFWRATGSTDYIGFSTRTFDNALITQDHVNQVGSLSYAWTAGRWSSKVELGHMVDEISQGRIEDAIGVFESPDFAQTRRASVGWQNDLDLSSANRLSLGAMYYDENADTWSFGAIDTGVVNAYVQDRIALERHSIVLAAGYVDHESFGGHATWNTEYGFDLTDSTQLVAAAGTAFRAPDATDRFGFGGNPELEPEQSLNYELGLRHDIGAGQRVFLTAFQNEIEDLIEYIVTNPITFDGELRNAERARIRGVEAAYEIARPAWRLRTEAVYQDAENLTTEQPLLRRAETNFVVSYARLFGPVELGLDALAAGERKDFGGITLDSYVLMNLSARYTFAPGWSAQARVENLFDEDYVVADGYNTQDRSLFVTLRYAPDR
jgi:vitamin B12 transporter